MPDYKAMYYRLAGKVADAIDVLSAAQLENEESVMQDDAIMRLLEDESGDP